MALTVGRLTIGSLQPASYTPTHIHTPASMTGFAAVPRREVKSQKVIRTGEAKSSRLVPDESLPRHQSFILIKKNIGRAPKEARRRLLSAHGVGKVLIKISTRRLRPNLRVCRLRRRDKAANQHQGPANSNASTRS